MRITNTMMTNNMIRNQRRNLERMQKLQENMATGKKFTRPSDDPIGVSRSLRLNTDISMTEQYKRNVDDCLSWMSNTEQALKNVESVLQRTQVLTIQASTEIYSAEQRQSIAIEVKQLKNQLIHIGNTNYAGSSIFSGYKTDKPIFKEDGSFDVGGMTLKSNELIEINIGTGNRISINIPAQRIFGVGDTEATIDTLSDIDTTKKSQMIGLFDKLMTDLDNGDLVGIKKCRELIDNHLNNVGTIISEIGAKMNRLELTNERIADDTVNMKELLSKNEDADMAEVAMLVKQNEAVYNASLAASARVIQMSLVDFLK